VTVLAAATPALGDLLAYDFMRHAFVAGAAIALASGLVGFFVVLRAQVFTGDALSHVAFTGALAALAAGLDPRIGLFAATILVALLLGVLGPQGRADDVVIGSVFAWVLGLGVLFLGLFTRNHSGRNSTAGVAVLFGSIFGLDAGQTTVAAAIGAAVALAVVAVARPLLFASVDPAVAEARGLPVRALGLAFLALVGVVAAEATQAVGALLLVSLLAAPAAAASRLTARPLRALALSGLLAVAGTWAGLVLAYLVPRLPPSSAIVAVLAVVYLATVALTREPRRGPLH